MKLNQKGASPLYYLLKEDLKEKIKQGIYKSGERIPAEPELWEMYQVSRITVRRAVDELCKEGILEKRHGTGTFVKGQKIHRKIEHLMGFTDACKEGGMKASSLVVDIKRIKASDISEDALNGNEELIYIQRLRLADDEPVMLENNYFPAEHYAFLEKEDLSGSLYHLLQEKYGIVVSGSDNSYLDIIRADIETATLMKINSGDPLFFLHSEIYDQEGKIIHVGRQYINSERYRFYLTDQK